MKYCLFKVQKATKKIVYRVQKKWFDHINSVSMQMYPGFNLKVFSQPRPDSLGKVLHISSHMPKIVYNFDHKVIIPSLFFVNK